MNSATEAPATQVAEQAPEPRATEAPAPEAEDRRTQRRGLAAMWAGPGGAVAAMVAVSWYIVVRNGGDPPGGDMVGHAAAAEWFRTQPWWDWRGWSDWFYGGQAMGVNYPPLGHAWMRFTHPVYGQLAAVTVGLLVLLPWGALRLARAVGYPAREQRLAVGAVFVLTAVSAGMHWFLPGLQYSTTFFGSWPAMLATTLGLFCAAWAAAAGSRWPAGWLRAPPCSGTPPSRRVSRCCVLRWWSPAAPRSARGCVGWPRRPARRLLCALGGWCRSLPAGAVLCAGRCRSPPRGVSGVFGKSE